MDMDTETTFSLPTTTAPTDFTGPACPPSSSLNNFISSPHHLPSSGGSTGTSADLLPWDTGIAAAAEPGRQNPAKRLCQGLFNFRGCKRSESSSESGASSVSESSNVPYRSVEEACKRSLAHFPSPSLLFPQPALEFDFRVAVKLRPAPSRLDPRPSPPSSSAGSTSSAGSGTTAAGSSSSTPREITAISSGCWSGSFGHGKVLAGGYDLGQARGFRPIRIVEGVFVMQTTDDTPAVLEMRTRGSLSGPCDVLDSLLSPVQTPKTIDPRRYGFRMFSTIKTADKRYAEIVNCGLWVASGVWRGDELIIDAYRVT